nr:hypothetical protein LTR18_006719 [Exophiala xenobiotica]
MHLLYTQILYAIVALQFLLHDVGAVSSWEPLVEREGFQTLKAARKSADSVPRSNSLNPVFGAELLYAADETLASQGLMFLSTIRFESPKPVVVLDDIQCLFENLQCSNTTVDIEFRDSSVFDDAQYSWMDLKGGYLISSTLGCADEGTHTPFQ